MIKKLMGLWNKLMEPTNLKYTVLCTLYTSLFVLAPFMSNRVVAPFGLTMVAGSIFISIALCLLDVINNDFGIRKAKDVLISSVVIRGIIWGLISIVLTMPIVRDTVGYADIIQLSAKILIVGEACVFISQYFIDVHIFNYMKKKFKWFWVRFIFSNTVSHLLSIWAFIFIIFGNDPHINLWALFIGSTITRYLMQLSLTPIMSLFVYRDKNVL